MTNQSSPSSLQFENVSKVFVSQRGIWKKPAEKLAVSNISFDLNPGETIVLVGESGSGKTTVGRMATGLIDPTSGTIRYNGKDVSQMSGDEFMKYRLSVQMIHQDPYASLNPVITIGQTLMAPLLQHGFANSRAEARDQAEQLVKRVELGTDCLDKYPHQLSGGQRQRISVARAITVQPKVMVADESVSMMDVSLRVGLLDLLLDLQKTLGISFIFITHDLGVVRYFGRGQTSIVMYRGHVVERGETEQVITSPKHPYTKALRMAVPVPDPSVARNRPELPLKNVDTEVEVEDDNVCPFVHRCIYAKDRCWQGKPALEAERSDDHLTACYFVKDIS